MIGFIPCDEEIRTKWWRERTAETFVVGQWNYIMEMSKEPLYILAKQLPEPSGLASLGIGYEMEDRTLVVENDTLSSHAGFLTQEELEKNQTLIGAFTEQIPI